MVRAVSDASIAPSAAGAAVADVSQTDVSNRAEGHAWLRVISLLACPVMEGRLRIAVCRDALPGPQDEAMRSVRGWREADRLARIWQPHLAVFDPISGALTDLAAVRGFCEANRAVVLVAYAGFVTSSAHSILLLGQCGVRDVIERNRDDTPTRLRQILRRALNSRAPAELLALLDGLPDELERSILRLYEESEHPLNPLQAAQLFGKHPKTVRERLRRQGLPPLARLIAWLRLIRAAHMLTHECVSLGTIARQMQFPSSVALGNQLRRYSGLCCGDIRYEGIQPLIGAFQRELRTPAARTLDGPGRAARRPVGYS